MNRSYIYLLLGLACTGASTESIHAQPAGLVKSLKKLDQNFCKALGPSCRTHSSNHGVLHSRHVVTKKTVAVTQKPPVENITGPPIASTVKLPAIPKQTTKHAVIPLPHLNPMRQIANTRPPAAPLPPSPVVENAPSNAEKSACLQALRSEGDDFSPDLDEKDAVATGTANAMCHVENPVRLRSVKVQKGQVELPEVPLLSCKYAVQFSKWLSESAAPNLSAQLGSTVGKISTGPGYVCRGRNGDMFAKVNKISEHAYGDAVDVSSFVMKNGKSVIVADALNSGSPSYEILRGLRLSACGYFTTVLGPGSNTAHATHFHLDLEVRGKSGTYRICE